MHMFLFKTIQLILQKLSWVNIILLFTGTFTITYVTFKVFEGRYHNPVCAMIQTRTCLLSYMTVCMYLLISHSVALVWRVYMMWFVIWVCISCCLEYREFCVSNFTHLLSHARPDMYVSVTRLGVQTFIKTHVKYLKKLWSSQPILQLLLYIFITNELKITEVKFALCIAIRKLCSTK